MSFENAMKAGLHGDEWDWEDSKACAMDILAKNAGTLEKYKEKNVVYAVKNILMVAHALQVAINDNITDANMPRNFTFKAVTELDEHLRLMKQKEHEEMKEGEKVGEVHP